jgi:hypothetical protein
MPVVTRTPNYRRAPAHLGFIRALRICLICGRIGDVDPMHVRGGTDGGMGLKPSDKYTVPGCRKCHQHQHRIGEDRFWGGLGIDPMDVALRLWRISGDMMAGRRAIERGRQTISLYQSQLRN